MENNEQNLRVCFNLKLSTKISIVPKIKNFVDSRYIHTHTYSRWCVGVNWISLCILRLIFQYLVLVLCLSSPRFKCAHRERERERIAVVLVTHHKVWESNLFRSLFAFFFCGFFSSREFSHRLGWNSMTYSDISRYIFFLLSDKFRCCVAFFSIITCDCTFNDDHHFISDDVLSCNREIYLKEMSVLFIIIFKFIY